MAQVLPHAKVVSVLADYPCYRWIHRTDGSNASDAEVDQRSYWGYYAGVLRTMEASAGPGPLLDATRVTAMVAAFTRIPTRDFLRWDLPDRARTFDALQGFVNEQFPPWFDEQIPVLKRLRVQALRSGEMSRFEQLLRWRTNMEFTFALASVRWVDGRMLIGVDASLVDEEGDLLAMDQVGDSLVLPAGLGPPRGAGAALCVLTTTEQGAGEITIRHRESGVEWPVERVEHPNAAPADEQHNLKMHLEGRVDPARGFFGRELETGIWDVLVRVQFLGERQVRRIPVDAKTPVPSRPQHVGGREVRVYRTKAGTLAMKISTGATPPIGVLKAHWEADHLVIHIDVPETGTGTGTQLVFRQRSAGNEQRVAVQDGTARFVLGHSDRGDIFDFYLRTSVRDGGFQDQRLAFGSAQVSQRQPYRIYATVHGSFSVKHLGPSSTPPRTRAQRVHGWLSRRGRFPTR